MNYHQIRSYRHIRLCSQGLKPALGEPLTAQRHRVSGGNIRGVYKSRCGCRGIRLATLCQTQEEADLDLGPSGFQGAMVPLAASVAAFKPVLSLFPNRTKPEVAKAAQGPMEGRVC